MTYDHNQLTHWGRVTQIYVTKLTIIGSDNGLSPGRRQAIILTNAGILLIGPLGTNSSEIVIFIQEKAFENVVWKMAAILSRPQCVKHATPIPIAWHQNQSTGIYLMMWVVFNYDTMSISLTNCVLNRFPPERNGTGDNS